MAYRSNKTGKVSKEVRYLNKDFSQIRNNFVYFRFIATRKIY